MDNQKSVVSIWFDDYKDKWEAVDKFKEEIEEDGFMDCNNFFTDKAMDTSVAVDDRGIHLIWNIDLETYRSFGYSTFNLNQFQDWDDLEYELQFVCKV